MEAGSITSRIRVNFSLILFILFTFLLVNNKSFAQTYYYSDNNWRASNVFYPGWEFPGFNDTGWGFSAAPNPLTGPYNCQMYIPNPNVIPMWNNANVSPDTAYLRRNFTINNVNTLCSANMTVSVDDYISVWVNGTPVVINFHGTVAPFFTSVNILSNLVTGANVIAIRGVDVALYQRVCFLLVITNSVPLNITGNNSICSGQSTTLTVTGGVHYTWNTGDTTSVITVHPVSTTTYTVTGADSSGYCLQTDTFTVSVSSPPVSVSPTAVTICPGSSTTLTASGAATYSWSPANGLNTTVGATVIASPLTTTTYTVTGIIGACSGTAAVTVTVSPPPPVSISPDSVAICSGNSVTLNATGASTYSWSPPNGLNTTVGATVIANPSLSATYTVTGTSSIGCTNTAGVIVDVASPLTITPSSGTICTGDSITLSASGGTTNIYAWSPSTGLNHTIGASVKASPSVTTTYYCTSNCGGNDNLIVNGNFSSGNTGFTSAYTLVPSPGSGDAGEYIVANNASAHHSAWTCTDHTTGTGNFMILDGSTTANTDVWCETVAVTPNTNYSFSCWASAMTDWWNLNPATLHFYFNGIDIGGHLQPPLAQVCNWFQYQNIWNSGSNTSVSICIVDSCTQYGGNDFAIDDISLIGPGIIVTDSVTVTVNPTPTVTVPANVVVCNNDSVAATNFISTLNGATFAWTNNNTAIGLAASGTGNIAGFNATNAGTTPITATITVTPTLNGCVGIPSVYTITVNPNPLITFTPASDSLCTGDTIALTVSGASTYIWAPATGLSSTSGSNVNAFPTTTTTYTVTATSIAGCTSTSTIIITVNPVPTVSVSPTADTLCASNSVTLTASGAATYNWTPATGLSATTGATVTATPTTTTTYTVTGSTASGCTSTTNIIVTVNPLPVLAIIPAVITICPGDSVTLTASGAATYSWSPATGLNTTTGASVTATPAATTTYTVTGTSNGCTASDTITVNVSSNLPITVTPSSPEYCFGGSAQITASGATNYTWSPSTGLNTVNGANVTANPVATTTYTVSGTTGGCSGSADVTVTVNPNPVISITPDSISICPGTNYVLTASGASTYTWSPTTGLNPSTGSVVTATPTATTTYTVVGSTTAGCTGTNVAVVKISEPGKEIFVPNVFTPNGDGLNDVFHVVSTGEPDVNGMIFNRWGELIFTWSGKNNGWDGTFKGRKVPDGVYVYIISSVDECGTKFTKYGTITLLR